MKNDNKQKQTNKDIFYLVYLGKIFSILWILYYYFLFFISWYLVDSEVNSRGGLDGKVKRLIGFVNRKQETHYLEQRRSTCLCAWNS